MDTNAPERAQVPSPVPVAVPLVQWIRPPTHSAGTLPQVIYATAPDVVYIHADMYAHAPPGLHPPAVPVYTGGRNNASLTPMPRPRTRAANSHSYIPPPRLAEALLYYGHRTPTPVDSRLSGQRQALAREMLDNYAIGPRLGVMAHGYPDSFPLSYSARGSGSSSGRDQRYSHEQRAFGQEKSGYGYNGLVGSGTTDSSGICYSQPRPGDSSCFVPAYEIDNRQRYQAGLPLIVDQRGNGSPQRLGKHRMAWRHLAVSGQVSGQVTKKPATRQPEPPQPTVELSSSTPDPYKKYLERFLKRTHRSSDSKAGQQRPRPRTVSITLCQVDSFMDLLSDDEELDCRSVASAPSPCKAEESA